MSRTRVWRQGVLSDEDFPIEKVSDYLEQDDCVVWADLCVPDRDDLDQIADELGLDPLAVEDALEHHERPKIERYPTHKFLTMYGLSFAADGTLQLAKVSAFLLPRALVTVRREDFDPEPVVRAWDSSPDLLQYGAVALLYGLLDVVVDGHLDAIQQLDDRVDEVEDSLFDDEQTKSMDVQRSTYELRRAMTGVRKVVVPMREMLDTMIRHHDPVPLELGEHFRDVSDHVVRANEWVDSLRDTVTAIFETGLSLADARLNQIVRKLSAWAAIIAVPTAVTGFYGQNVPYPGFGEQYGFWLSTAVTALLAFGAWLGFKKKGWL
jgi:magnesium transporter